MRGFQSRADVEAFQAWVDALPAPLTTETVALGEAAGRVLASDLVSEVDVPGFARAAMDGWAVRAEDTYGAAETDPVALDLVGVTLPGAPLDRPVGTGEAARIMTGAPVPAGADAVLRAEDGREEAGRVEVRAAVTPGRHVGAVGEDVRKGVRVLARGRGLRAQDLGVAASVGCGTLAVVRRPRVSLVVTGDELVPAGQRPEGTRIVDSNTPMLTALVTRDGGVLEEVSRCRDDREAVAEALRTATADVVLVSGGSSVGQEDHAPRLLAELGQLVFHGVAMRPAAPAGAGLLGERPVFLLPGNPVSCLSAYDFFAGRLVRRRGGRPPAWPYASRRLPLGAKVSSLLGRVDYVRVRVEEGRVVPVMSRGASILTSTTESDGFLVVPQDSEGWAPGTPVRLFLYD
ncbi:MAG: molybdopterin molybdotransferase MoeA, partial [Planctomycetota bacterium]